MLKFSFILNNLRTYASLPYMWVIKCLTFLSINVISVHSTVAWNCKTIQGDETRKLSCMLKFNLENSMSINYFGEGGYFIFIWKSEIQISRWFLSINKRRDDKHFINFKTLYCIDSRQKSLLYIFKKIFYYNLICKII